MTSNRTSPATNSPATSGRRSASAARSTKETSIEVAIDLDGTGQTDISTGIPFYDHMLDQLGRHGGFDLTVKADGDLHIDTHHTVEDTAIVVGEAFAERTRRQGGRSTVRQRSVSTGRGAWSRSPSTCRADRSSSGTSSCRRPFPSVRRRSIRRWRSTLCRASRPVPQITLHVTLKEGRNVHHIIEAAFKGVARCLRDAVRVEDGAGVPSTKGTLVSGPKIAVLDYGIGNLRSAQKGLERPGPRRS